MSGTPNLKLNKPDFNQVTWHDEVNENFDILDAAVFGYTTARNVQGVWQNFTLYSVGQVLVDSQNGFLYECLVGHTSAASPTTFAQDRAAHTNPPYWSLVTSFATYRGEWQTATDYNVGDFVVNSNAYTYAVCNTAHTSSAVWADDSANWDYLIEAETIANFAESAASSASDAAGYAATLDEFVEDIHDFQWEPNRRWADQIVDLGTTGGAVSLDLSLGNVFLINLNADAQLSVTGLTGAPSDAMIGVTLKVTHNTFCIDTWPSGTLWPDDTEPTQDTSAVSIFSLVSFDGGTSWNAVQAGAGYTA